MKIAIITGASSGMGREFIHELDKRLNDVSEIWCISRSIDTAELPETMCRIRRIALDITKKEDIEKFKVIIEAEKPGIKVLVNSAGIGRAGLVTELSYDIQMAEINLNCNSLFAITKICVPYMIQGGYIINLASSAAFMPQFNFAVYAATKSFVLSFSRGLRYELKDKKVSVTAVCPGPVDTAFFDEADKNGASFGFKKNFMAKPEKVVKKAVADAVARKQKSVYGISMKTFDFFAKVVPHSILLNIYEAIVKKGS